MLRGLVRLARVGAVVGAVLVGLSPIVLVAGRASAAPQLNGGGSSFAALEIQQWQADTARKPYSLNINYNSTGSTDGRDNFATGLYDFAASDVVYTTEDGNVPTSTARCPGGQPLTTCFVYVPVTAGGLAFMYNLIGPSGSRVTNLNLTPDEVCKIFTGAITSWNDPELVGTNPFLSSFAGRSINVRVRSDGAGESYVLSQFCIAVDPAVWQQFVMDQKTGNQPDEDPAFLAGGPVSNWPVAGPSGTSFDATEFADGVADAIADPVAGVNSIGYVADGYAKVRNFPVASVQNEAGVFTQPTAINVTVALGYALPAAANPGTFTLKYSGPDPRAYFPSTYSYLLAQTTGWDPTKGAELGQFACFDIGQGQTVAPTLGYAALSSVVVGIAVTEITKIPGAPTASQCTAGAPAPPPPPVIVQQNGSGTTGAKGSTSTGTGSSTGTGTATGAAPTPGSPITTANGVVIGTVPPSVGCTTTPVSTPSAPLPTTTATTTHSAATTTLAPTTTTNTTVPCTDGVAPVIGPDSVTTIQAVPISAGGPTSGQVLSSLLEGAAVCAIGLAVVGWRKGGVRS